VAGKIEIGNFKMSWGGASKKDVGPTFDLKGTDAWQNIFGFSDNFSEEPVSERRALGLATVYTCMNVRARTIASLPCNVYQEQANGDKKVITDHPVYWLLSQEPNNYMSSANMTLTETLHADGWGNSIVGINRYARTGEPKSLDLICPGEWDVVKRDGEAWYKINGEMYPSRDVLHYRWFSLDGLMGLSPIIMNKITMGKAFKQERYEGMTLGQRPPGFLTYEGNLNSEQRAQNQKSWKDDLTTGKTPVLTGKWDYKYSILPPDATQYIMGANLTDQKIYGIFQLPPSFAQNYERMTWSNAENADLVYAKHTITPICRVREQEQNMKLFSEKEKKTMFTKYNMNGLLRGDITARAAFYTAMRNIGGMNGNEIRNFEDMNAYEGGEIYTVQGANIPVDQLRDHYKAMSDSAEQQQAPQPINGKMNGHAMYN
jgi:HK97 family phage portal protein